TLSLLVRDGTLNLGSGANAVTFQYGMDAYFNNTNLFAGDGVVDTLGTFSLADGQGGANQRTIEKVGNGTAILNNVAYANPVAGTDASANFTWNIGNATQTAYGG